MNASNKPSIVFCHGIWADGSCFNKLIPPLLSPQFARPPLPSPRNTDRRPLRVPVPPFIPPRADRSAPRRGAAAGDRVERPTSA